MNGKPTEKESLILKRTETKVGLPIISFIGFLITYNFLGGQDFFLPTRKNLLHPKKYKWSQPINEIIGSPTLADAKAMRHRSKT